VRLVYYPRQVNKVGNIPSAKIHSSGLLIPLIPHRIKKYTDILTRQEHALKRKYKNRNLSQVFDTLHRKIIAIGPIAVCDYLCLDLGKKCPETILSSIGTISLQISSHDDAVDETPNDQSDLAALIYAGNIASLEAIKNLIENGYKNIAKILIDIVNRNHFLQQKRVELLWKKSPKNFLDYKKGVADGAELIKIGSHTALEFCGRNDLRKKLTKFATHYALALQLIDDIIEVEEDRKSGYHSFPLLEGNPFTKSINQARKNIKTATHSVNKEWKFTKSLLKNVEDVVNQVENSLKNAK